MKYVYKFYEFIVDKSKAFIDYVLDRIKTMIILREQDKWMRQRSQKLSKRHWHEAYVEESKKIIPEVWEDEETNEE